MYMHSPFKHIQAAHCESGVTNSLLRNIGIDKMTKQLAFGIGSGLFFVSVLFLKISGGPAIAFRSFPVIILNQPCQSLGIRVTRKKFSSRQAAQLFLDQCLEQGLAVGCQVGVYYLPYFPKEYRFHFNAHNLIVYEKEKDHYFVSDPIMETVASLSEYELERVRFAKGALAPRGQLYYPSLQGQTIDDGKMKQAIRFGIRKNIFNMFHIPGPIQGVKGMPLTARTM